MNIKHQIKILLCSLLFSSVALCDSLMTENSTLIGKIKTVNGNEIEFQPGCQSNETIIKSKSEMLKIDFNENCENLANVRLYAGVGLEADLDCQNGYEILFKSKSGLVKAYSLNFVINDGVIEIERGKTDFCIGNTDMIKSITALSCRLYQNRKELDSFFPVSFQSKQDNKSCNTKD